MIKKSLIGFYALFTISCLGSIFISCSNPAERMAEDLQAQIDVLVKDFKGDVGIYIHHLSSGITIGINENDLYPTASMIKVPILIKIFDRIDRGELKMDSTLIYYKDSINYQWKGDDITIGKLLTHMITFSDNHASLWLQKLAGTGTEINQWLEEAGFASTRVNSRTPGREEDYEAYGWGVTSPREMAELLRLIRKGEAVSNRASEEMYRHLTRIYWDDEALSQIPPTVQVASKQGAVNQSRSEVVLVNAPHGDYVFCVITKNQEDESWVYENEGYRLIRKISRLTWTYFEPDYPWEPATD